VVGWFVGIPVVVMPLAPRTSVTVLTHCDGSYTPLYEGKERRLLLFSPPPKASRPKSTVSATPRKPPRPPLDHPRKRPAISPKARARPGRRLLRQKGSLLGKALPRDLNGSFRPPGLTFSQPVDSGAPPALFASSLVCYNSEEGVRGVRGRIRPEGAPFPMKYETTLFAFDYHHGQSTRVLVGGVPFLKGDTVLDKQTYMLQNYDYIRKACCLEPRGHRNMLGAVIVDPVNEGSDASVIFLHGGGYFDMCGDSAFSAAAALVESGIARPRPPRGEVVMDTVAGTVRASVETSPAGDVESVAIANVPSFYLGQAEAEVGGGPVPLELAYGGLVYAFADARALGVDDLRSADRQALLLAGTDLLESARESVLCSSPRWPEPRGIDLVTLFEPLEDAPGFRVANFYAPMTMGRTPSGTGLSARMAERAAKGDLERGGELYHESVLGLRFRGRVEELRRSQDGTVEIEPMIATRTYLMGIYQLVIKDDDPFKDGFEL